MEVNQGGKFLGPINTPKIHVIPTDGGTTALSCGTTIMLNPGGISAHTVTMPASPPAAGCTVSLAGAFTITTLTMTDPAARPIYGPLTNLADQFSKWSELAEPSERDDDGYDPTQPKPCIHCGFGFGHHTNDLPADNECYCNMEG